MIRAIFFDFDGTISDARAITHETFIEMLEERGLKFDREKVHSLMGWKMEIILERLSISTRLLRPLRREFYRRLLKKLKEERLNLCVSVEPLKKLKKKYKLIVISNSETRFVKASARKLKIMGLFHKILGAEKFKSKDEILERLFRKYKINAKEAVYIGDRFSDVEYARAAGCWAVAISNSCSWSSRKDLLKEKPDFIIENFSQLRKVIQKIDSTAKKN